MKTLHGFLRDVVSMPHCITERHTQLRSSRPLETLVQTQEIRHVRRQVAKRRDRYCENQDRLIVAFAASFSEVSLRSGKEGLSYLHVTLTHLFQKQKTSPCNPV